MIEEKLLDRLPKEPTVKQVRLALKFGKEFSQIEKMRMETIDDEQSMVYYLEVIDTTVDFIKFILSLKAKESAELEDWTMERLIKLAFALFYRIVSPNNNSETEKVEAEAYEKK